VARLVIHDSTAPAFEAATTKWTNSKRQRTAIATLQARFRISPLSVAGLAPTGTIRIRFPPAPLRSHPPHGPDSRMEIGAARTLETGWRPPAGTVPRPAGSASSSAQVRAHIARWAGPVPDDRRQSPVLRGILPVLDLIGVCHCSGGRVPRSGGNKGVAVNPVTDAGLVARVRRVRLPSPPPTPGTAVLLNNYRWFVGIGKGAGHGLVGQ